MLSSSFIQLRHLHVNFANFIKSRLFFSSGNIILKILKHFYRFKDGVLRWKIFDIFKLMNLTFYWISIMFKMNRKYFFRKWRKLILFFHNISSTVLKGLHSKKTRMIFSAWKKKCLLDFLKISQKSCEDSLFLWQAAV